MVKGVAQEMIERSFEALQDVPVDGRKLADDLQSGALSKSVGEIAHHAGEHLDAVRKGSHAAVQDLVVEPRGEVEEIAIEAFRFLQAFDDRPSHDGHTVMQLIPSPGGACAQRSFGEGVSQAIQSARELLLLLLEAEHLPGEAIEPTRSDTGFAGEPEQAVEIVGGHADRAVGGGGRSGWEIRLRWW
jgi:hypothetical protein